jgi:hypothetical protein
MVKPGLLLAVNSPRELYHKLQDNCFFAISPAAVWRRIALGLHAPESRHSDAAPRAATTTLI